MDIQQEYTEALREEDVRGLKKAVRKLRRILQTHMNAADKSLAKEKKNLRELSSQWGQELPQEPELAQAISELTELHETLYDAIEKHSLFQDLNNALTLLMDEARRADWNWDAVSSSWAFCRSHVLDSRFIPFAKDLGELEENEEGQPEGSPWCAEVVKLANALDPQIEAKERRAALNTIRDLSTAVRKHFFIADKELKVITSNLGNLARELLAILGV